MNFRYTRHAIMRMTDRDFSTAEVEEAVIKGIIIREYPDDKPNPSALAVNIGTNGPLHVVYSISRAASESVCFIVTVYRPDPKEWNATFTKRRKKI